MLPSREFLFPRGREHARRMFVMSAVQYQRAVSYTHLDVYKRQAVESLLRADYSSVIIDGVRNQLDVYKRQPLGGLASRGFSER